MQSWLIGINYDYYYELLLLLSVVIVVCAYNVHGLGKGKAVCVIRKNIINFYVVPLKIIRITRTLSCTYLPPDIRIYCRYIYYLQFWLYYAKYPSVVVHTYICSMFMQ